MSQSEHEPSRPPNPASPALTEIAERVLGIATLEVRQSDALDFHEVGVASLRRALEDAFEAGARAASPAVRGGAGPPPDADPEAWELYDRPGAPAAAGRLEAALAARQAALETRHAVGVGHRLAEQLVVARDQRQRHAGDGLRLA